MIAPPLSSAAQLAHDIIILIIYLLAGAAIKYVDQAYDIKAFKKKTALLIAIATGLVLGALMILDPPSAAIFMAVAAGVALSRKIDNIAFYIGLALVVLLPLMFLDATSFMWPQFLILLASALADEYGNDWADKRTRDRKRAKVLSLDAAAYFFRYRFAMKLTVLGLVAASMLPLVYLPAFLQFDVGYIIMEKLSWILKPFRLKVPWQYPKPKKKAHRERTQPREEKRPEDKSQQKLSETASPIMIPEV